MAFEIESEVAAPMGSRFGRPCIYPFGKMQVGDSFSYPTDQRRRIVMAAHQFGRRNGIKFTSRTNGETCRVWRIS